MWPATKFLTIIRPDGSKICLPLIYTVRSSPKRTGVDYELLDMWTIHIIQHLTGIYHDFRQKVNLTKKKFKLAWQGWSSCKQYVYSLKFMFQQDLSWFTLFSKNWSKLHWNVYSCEIFLVDLSACSNKH